MRGGLTLWLLDTSFWKDALFRRMQINPEDPGAWKVHRDIPWDYALQTVSEQKAIVRNKRSGQTKEEWQKVTEHSANHYWDCECYALAAAEMLGVRYLQERKQSGSGRGTPEGDRPDGQRAIGPVADSCAAGGCVQTLAWDQTHGR